VAVQLDTLVHNRVLLYLARRENLRINKSKKLLELDLDKKKHHKLY
jgi:hypothetical protein